VILSRRALPAIGNDDGACFSLLGMNLIPFSHPSDLYFSCVLALSEPLACQCYLSDFLSLFLLIPLSLISCQKAACLMAAALVAALAPTAVTSPSGSHKIGFAVPKPLDLKMRRSGGHMAYSVQAMGTSRLLLGRALSPPALAPLHAFMRSGRCLCLCHTLALAAAQDPIMSHEAHRSLFGFLIPLHLAAPRGISVAASTAADDVTDEEAMEEVDIDAAIDIELARLNALLTAGGFEGESLSKALKQIECGGKAVVTAGKLEKAIKKKSGAFSSLVEFCVEEGSKQDVEDVSRACRMGKAAAIVIDVGFALDGRGRDTTLQVCCSRTLTAWRMCTHTSVHTNIHSLPHHTHALMAPSPPLHTYRF